MIDECSNCSYPKRLHPEHPFGIGLRCPLIGGSGPPSFFETNKKASYFHRSEVISVVKTEVCEGEGTEENMMREVIYYSDLEGNLLAKHDPCEKE